MFHTTAGFLPLSFPAGSTVHPLSRNPKDFLILRTPNHLLHSFACEPGKDSVCYFSSFADLAYILLANFKIKAPSFNRDMSDAMEYRCFIGGLSWSTSDRTLEDAFEKFGHIIEAKIVVDRDTGRSRGFGFVTFDDKKAMEEAISRMHGMELDGRSITVDKAQPKSAGGDRSDRGYGGGGRGYSGGGGGGGGSECFKCGQRGHFARECPSGDGHRGGDRYGSKSGDRYGGGGGNNRYGPDRSGDRHGGRSRDGGSRGFSGGNDRYNRDRSGPYERPSGGGPRTYDDRR